jgi:ADP-ribose pyrophosphatase YjhB (NUDIX family)
MRYCNQCGAEVIRKVPEGDDRQRHVCISCGEIHYQNPKIVAGCIAEHEGKVLLCKRAIKPRHGYWTLPGGFMELEETSLEAALRETLEEANARVTVLELYTVFNLPYVNQVYMMYRSQLQDLDFSAGKESLEVKLFAENEIPWGDIAFATIKYTLKFFFQDQRNKQFRLHTGDIINQGGGSYGFRPRP